MRSNATDILLNQVPYSNRPRVKTDVEAAIAGSDRIGSLQPKVGDYVHVNGTMEKLLYLTGTVPIFYAGAQYNIPVDLYIPRNYPTEAPFLYVRPTGNMVVKQNHRHVDMNGFVYLPYLHEWNSTHQLVPLVEVASSVFSIEPPLFTKAAGAPTPSHTPVVTPNPAIQQQQQQPMSAVNMAASSANAAASSAMAWLPKSLTSYYTTPPILQQQQTTATSTTATPVSAYPYPAVGIGASAAAFPAATASASAAPSSATPYAGMATVTPTPPVVVASPASASAVNAANNHPYAYMNTANANSNSTSNAAANPYLSNFSAMGVSGAASGAGMYGQPMAAVAVPASAAAAATATYQPLPPQPPQHRGSNPNVAASIPTVIPSSSSASSSAFSASSSSSAAIAQANAQIAAAQLEKRNQLIAAVTERIRNATQKEYITLRDDILREMSTEQSLTHAHENLVSTKLQLQEDVSVMEKARESVLSKLQRLRLLKQQSSPATAGSSTGVSEAAVSALAGRDSPSIGASAQPAHVDGVTAATANVTLNSDEHPAPATASAVDASSSAAVSEPATAPAAASDAHATPTAAIPATIDSAATSAKSVLGGGHTPAAENSIEQLLTPTDDLSAQITKVQGEISAIHDALFHYERALMQSSNPLDLKTFAREVRELSRREFLHKVLLRKIVGQQRQREFQQQHGVASVNTSHLNSPVVPVVPANMMRMPSQSVPPSSSSAVYSTTPMPPIQQQQQQQPHLLSTQSVPMQYGAPYSMPPPASYQQQQQPPQGYGQGAYSFPSVPNHNIVLPANQQASTNSHATANAGGYAMPVPAGYGASR